MSEISYFGAWSAYIQELMEIKKDRHGMWMGYPGSVKWINDRGGRFVDWDKIRLPLSVAADDLGSAVEIGSVLPTHEYYFLFLEWANEAARRALSDKRFDIDPEAERLKGNPNWAQLCGWRSEGSYPGIHGAILAAGCLARALRDNSELDTPSLLQACDEMAESALHGGSTMWDYIAQGEYLRCVRLSLVAGDVSKARYFLKNTTRKFKQSSVHQLWLQALVNAINAANGSPLALEAEAEFQAFFDTVRDPAYKPVSNQPGGVNLYANRSILRLELAIIKQRYVLCQPLAGNWKSILGLISE
jgi:hypothetical protein